MPPRPDGASPAPPPNKYAQNQATAAAALRDALPARPGSCQSSGSSGAAHTLFPRCLPGVLGAACEEADGDNPGWQTRAPKPPVFLPGPGRASSGWGRWSLAPGMDVCGGRLAPERGGPIPPPITGLSVLPPAAVLFRAPRAQAGRVPCLHAETPLGQLIIGVAVPCRRRNNREGGVRWEPGGAGQEPLPSLLTQDVEFA